MELQNGHATRGRVAYVITEDQWRCQRSRTWEMGTGSMRAAGKASASKINAMGEVGMALHARAPPNPHLIALVFPHLFAPRGMRIGGVGSRLSGLL